jgi:hypothetical protein
MMPGVNMNTTADILEAGPAAQVTGAIRQLNDRLRQSGAGGRIMITAGIAALPEATSALIHAAVISFDDFNADNDPHGEHDCASINIAGNDVIWKIDYFDLALNLHSPDPADPKVTRRVLTIMLAEEY